MQSLSRVNALKGRVTKMYGNSFVLIFNWKLLLGEHENYYILMTNLVNVLYIYCQSKWTRGLLEDFFQFHIKIIEFIPRKAYKNIFFIV